MSEIKADTQAIRRTVEGQAGWMRDALRRLVEVESPSDSKAAVDACGAVAARIAEGIGGRVKRHRQREFGDVLEIRWGATGGRGILLLGHLDTVWPLGTLAKMPWKEKDGRFFGPGVLDMKAGVAMALAAMRVLGDAGVRRPVARIRLPDILTPFPPKSCTHVPRCPLSVT